MGNILFEMIAQLLRQANDRTVQKSLVFNVWSFKALVLSSCFSGAILGAVVNRKQDAIDSIEDLISSNMSAVILEDSWLWWLFEGARRGNHPLDRHMKAIKPRLVSVPLAVWDDKVTIRIYHIEKFAIIYTVGPRKNYTAL